MRSLTSELALFKAPTLRNLGENSVRGLIFLEQTTFIEDTHAITIETADHLGVFETALKQGKRWERGPGIVIEYKLFPDEDREAGAFRIRIWDQLTIYAWSLPRKDSALA